MGVAASRRCGKTFPSSASAHFTPRRSCPPHTFQLPSHTPCLPSPCLFPARLRSGPCIRPSTHLPSLQPCSWSFSPVPCPHNTLPWPFRLALAWPFPSTAPPHTSICAVGLRVPASLSLASAPSSSAQRNVLAIDFSCHTSRRQ